jgi:hypothetical protein
MSEPEAVHKRQETCPYLGQHWDRSIRAMYPDLDNRCFARFQQVSFRWLFASKRLGGHVDLAYQRTACYGNFQQCEDYQKKRASRS